MTRFPLLLIYSLWVATALVDQRWFRFVIVQLILCSEIALLTNVRSSNIFKALGKAKKLNKFLSLLPNRVKQPLEDSEVSAGAFLCSILNGDGSGVTGTVIESMCNMCKYLTILQPVCISRMPLRLNKNLLASLHLLASSPSGCRHFVTHRPRRRVLLLALSKFWWATLKP